MTPAYYTLTPKTPRGARLAADAGNPVRWACVERRMSVAHTERPGPWLLLRPEVHGQNNFHQRWVHESDDTHFVCEPVEPATP